MKWDNLMLVRLAHTFYLVMLVVMVGWRAALTQGGWASLLALTLYTAGVIGSYWNLRVAWGAVVAVPLFFVCWFAPNTWLLPLFRDADTPRNLDAGLARLELFVVYVLPCAVLCLLMLWKRKPIRALLRGGASSA